MLLHIPEFLLNLGHEKYISIIGVIIPSWAVFMIILERLYPYTKGVKLFRRGFWIDLVWYTIIQSKVLEIVIFSYIIIGLKSLLGLDDFAPLSHLNFWLLLFIFFVSHDFYMYWMHRFQHNNKYLWRTHEAHHSVREIDWLAGSRSHFSEILINQTIEFAPIFLLLDRETALYMVPTKALLDALWGMWIHANINVNTGKLQYLINGPEMHQWHHANHYELFYRNYSTKIAAWDWIFGTGFLPGLKPISFKPTKPIMFGLPYAYPKGFFTQSWYAFVRFDFKHFEFDTFYDKILNFRKNIGSQILVLFGVKKEWTEENLFGTNNQRYTEDTDQIICQKCKSIEKYYYLEDQLVHICENCNSDSELEKFN